MNTVYDFVKDNNWVSRKISVDYMVVAGGGGGGTNQYYAPADGQVRPSGGGGAGGYRASGYGPSPLQGSALSLGLGTYAITVSYTHLRAHET